MENRLAETWKKNKHREPDFIKAIMYLDLVDKFDFLDNKVVFKSHSRRAEGHLDCVCVCHTFRALWMVGMTQGV